MEVKCNVTLRCWDLNTSGIIKKIVMTCYPLKLCEDGAVSWSKPCVSLFIAALNNIILCHGAWMFPLEQKRTQAGFISFKTAVPCISLRYMISVDFFSHPLYVSWLPGWYWKAGLLYSRRSKSVLSLQSRLPFWMLIVEAFKVCNITGVNASAGKRSWGYAVSAIWGWWGAFLGSFEKLS